MGFVADLVEMLRRALPPPRPDPPLPEGTPAGVLVPLVEAPAPSLLFTLRTDLVLHHKGEISFPGGVRHEDDPDLMTTALRETEEELGIPSSTVEILGALPAVHTIVSGYVIVPFVGWLAEVPPLSPSPIEVAEVLQLDLARLSKVEREVLSGEGRAWHAYELDGSLVWGATGRVLHQLLGILRDEGWAP
jgi:8-oxo-dGTP pyrophosphatase MutT (NUDIX family)